MKFVTVQTGPQGPFIFLANPYTSPPPVGATTVRTQAPRFDAPETWHEPRGDGELQMIVQELRAGYLRPTTESGARDRIVQPPSQFREGVEYVQFSRMTC